MEIAFGILGQTTMRMHGNLTAAWTHRRERNIVAALLTQPGKRMSIDTLVDWAWNEDEEHPRTPKGALYKNIMRIRQALNQADTAAAITAAGGGYQLEVDPGSIDYHVFRRAMRHAHDLSDRGDHRGACDAAHEALSLWRDEPLTGMTSQPAHDWRIFATENAWIPANTFLLSELLAADRPGLALQHLTDLSPAYTTELWFAKLRLEALVALRRTRAADEYFRDMHRYFRDDSDDQAAADLRACHDQLRTTATPTLTGGVTMGNDDQPNQRSSSDLPICDLPQDTSDFVGRTEVLLQLDELLTPGSGPGRAGVVTLMGSPGVGKTAMAVHWAHRAGSQFAGGSILIDMRGVGPAPRIEHTDVVNSILSALNYPVDHIVGPAGRAAKLRSLLSRQPMLIILDNAKDTGHVEPLFSTLADCTVLITARQRLSNIARRGHGLLLTLEPLTSKESNELLTRRLGSRSVREPDAVTDLAQMCAGIPLALTIVAERAASRTGSRLRTVVDQLRDRPMLLTVGDDGDSTNLHSAFSWSYQCLEAPAQAAFRLFGLHPGNELRADTLASAAGISIAAGRRALDLLVAAHLVQQPGDTDRYRIHDLLHQFARTLAIADSGADALRCRLASHYLHTAHNAHRTVYPHRIRPDMPTREPGCTPTRFADQAAAIRWCLHERTNLNALVIDAAEHDLHDYAWRLPNLTADLLDRYGFYDDIVTGLAISARSATVVGNVFAAASALNDIGHIYLLTGRDADAETYLQEALQLVKAQDDPVGILTVRLNMGLRHRHAGRFAEAADIYRRCLENAQAIGDPERQAVAAYSLGTTLVYQDQHHSALPHYHRALHLRRILGDDAGQVATQIQLADLHTYLGEFEQAHTHCSQASAQLEKVRDLAANMKLHTVRAHLAHAEGRHAEALELALAAVEIAGRSHTATGEARALTTLGHILAESGDLEPAREVWTRAIRLYRDRARHTKADALERRLHDLGTSPEIPATRSAEEDTITWAATPCERASAHPRNE